MVRLGTQPVSTRAASPVSDQAWTEIFPPFTLGRAAAYQFLWFLLLSPLVVYYVGSLQREGGALVLGYLFVFPGALGLGWARLYMVWAGIGAHRDEKRLLLAARAAFEEHARAYGEIRHLDLSLDGGSLTGLALAGSSLLVVQDGKMRKLLQTEVRNWRWELHSPAQIISNGNGFATLEMRAKDQRARERVNGFYLPTFDPARPEVQFRTSSEEVCRRWEVILENAGSGRTAVD